MNRKSGKKYKIADVNHVFRLTQRPCGAPIGKLIMELELLRTRARSKGFLNPCIVCEDGIFGPSMIMKGTKK